MSLARAISRGRALNARLAVNGMKNASRSFGTAAVTEDFCAALGAWAINRLSPAGSPQGLSGFAHNDKSGGGCYHANALGPSWPGSSRPSTSCFRRVSKTWMPGTIGERSDAVLRPAMAGHDAGGECQNARDR